MENKDFIEVNTIVCPQCKMKQTGITRITENGRVNLVSTLSIGTLYYEINPGELYILCAYLPCQHLIIREQLEEANRLQVKFPADVNKR